MDTMELCVEMDEDGQPPTPDERRVILKDHEYPCCLTYLGATEGMSWVEFYKWLGY